MKRRILLLPGDGIGPEVVREAKKVLEVVGKRYALQLEFREANLGGAAIDAEGTAYPASTQAAAREADAILLGAVGGPQWDSLPAAQRPERGCWRSGRIWIFSATFGQRSYSLNWPVLQVCARSE